MTSYPNNQPTTALLDGLQPTHPRNLWGQAVYAELLPEIEPFDNPNYFRPLSQAYDGHNSYWATPSPEPPLSDEFWQQVAQHLDRPTLQQAATALAAAIAEWEPNSERLIFMAVLRAGVPIADWLTRLLPGSQAVAMSLFVGLGVDQVALQTLQHDYPNHRFLFVDGWTGRGGVSRLLADLAIAPLAVLVDPWGWADFAGVQDDLFCPTACFTGPATLGFSRTFYQADDRMFGSYLFPERHTRPDLVRQWQTLCPLTPSSPPPARTRFFKQTDLRLHSNEVCRALINANPAELHFADQPAFAEREYGLLLALADQRRVPVRFNQAWVREYRTRVAATLHPSQP